MTTAKIKFMATTVAVSKFLDPSLTYFLLRVNYKVLKPEIPHARHSERSEESKTKRDSSLRSE